MKNAIIITVVICILVAAGFVGGLLFAGEALADACGLTGLCFLKSIDEFVPVTNIF